jgi:hypothetical protein
VACYNHFSIKLGGMAVGVWGGIKIAFMAPKAKRTNLYFVLP